MKKICLVTLLLICIAMFSGCIHITNSNFQAWSGPQEFDGQGGAFITKDGIDIYSAGTPKKKCRILGVIHTKTMSRASLMMLFGDSWSESSLLKEAKKRGGDAIIIVGQNTQTWLTGGSDANGQLATDASSEHSAILVKYVGEVQAQSVSPENEAKLIGHWTFISTSDMQVHGELDFTFLPHNRYKFISSLTNTNGQPFSQTPVEEGRYYFTGTKLVTWSDKDEKPDPPVAFSVADTQLRIQMGQLLFVFQRQAQ